MENQQEEKKKEKGKRLTTAQATILIAVGFLGSRFIGTLKTDSIFILALSAMLEITWIYGFISLLTKKGLRWR